MIYTKKGDRGKTSLGDGRIVSKDDLRVDCYGTFDELSSYIGLVRSVLTDSFCIEELYSVQKDLFLIQSILSMEKETSLRRLPSLDQARTTHLEKMIGQMEQNIDPICSFIIPGGEGSIASSHAQVARCICRRAERKLVHFAEENPVNDSILMYTNRLSDFLFTLANYILHLEKKKNISFSF